MSGLLPLHASVSDCTDAAAITNGAINYAGGSIAPHDSGTTATVACDAGYTLSGSATITCTAENWSTPPTCTPNGKEYSENQLQITLTISIYHSFRLSTYEKIVTLRFSTSPEDSGI